MTPHEVAEHPSNNFDGVRLVLALLVIWGHQDASKQYAADAAVMAFFVLSGMLVSTSWFADPNPWRFFLRRFLRIWPGLAFVVVVCAAAAYYFAGGPMAEIERLASVFYLRNLWLHVFDWSFFAWNPSGMNGSIWTLPFEADLYGALALLGVLGRRVLLFAAPLVWIAALSGAPTSAVKSSLGEAWSLYFAGFFFAGVALSWCRGQATSRVLLAAAAVGGAMMAFGFVDAGRLVLIPAITASIGVQAWPVLRSLSRFGDLSYGAYVWAWPVQQVTRLWLPSTEPVWLQMFVVVPQVLACAFVSWHLVEKRALRLKPRAKDATGDHRWLQWIRPGSSATGPLISKVFTRTPRATREAADQGAEDE